LSFYAEEIRKPVNNGGRMSTRIAINGFGRIGRVVFRAALARPDIEVVTVEKTGLTVSDVNAALKTAAESNLAGILGYSEAPLVSSDYNGCPLSSIVDAGTTHVIDNMVKVLSWYDNETGYSHRMVDLAAMIGVH
jgi:glyceraldehyde-3-phosphate dehydrogenase/erythrose-4-phosphate dehydrogenase